jgi:hypothetical protein
VPQLETQLAEAKHGRRVMLVGQYQRQIRDIYPELRAALEAAVGVQERAQRIYEEACGEIGSMAQTYLAPIAFAGFLRSEFVRDWSFRNDQRFGSADPVPPAFVPPAPRPNRSTAEIDSEAKKYVAVKTIAVPAFTGMPREKPITDSQRPVTLGAREPAQPPRQKRPDDLSPLGPDEVRVRVLRAGYPDQPDQACDGGQVIKVSKFTAERAAMNGAVTIIGAGEVDQAPTDTGPAAEAE